MRGKLLICQGGGMGVTRAVCNWRGSLQHFNGILIKGELMSKIVSEYECKNSICTAVTICDQNYLWGAILLISSFRYFKNSIPFLVCMPDPDRRSEDILSQFGDVSIVRMNNKNQRNLANRKAEALLLADSDFVAWVDVDCMALGNIDKYFIPEDGNFQIRKRGAIENAMVFSDHYTRSDDPEGIPRSILTKWCEDVAEKEFPALATTCSTCCLSFHKNLRNFISRWDEQIQKVLPNSDTGTVNWNDKVYFQIDESVLNSLLAFSDAAPAPNTYQLDKDPNAYLVHFNLRPKPWEGWQYHHLKHFDLILEIIDDLKMRGYTLPPTPSSFIRSNYGKIKRRTIVRKWYRDFKSSLRRTRALSRTFSSLHL